MHHFILLNDKLLGMNHNSDKVLSQSLRVETEGDSTRPENNSYFDEVKGNYNHNNDVGDMDSLGPLPAKWEKAYTENGEVYFIE